MKLVHPNFSYQMEFKECYANNIIIENSEMFSSIVYELLQQMEGREGKFVLSEDGSILKIPHHMYCIINPFDIELNSRKILSKLYETFNSEIQSTDAFMKLSEIYSNSGQLLEDIFDTLMFPLTYTTDININAFLKFMDIKIDVSDCDLIERIIDYMRLMHDVLGYNITVCVNIKSYLNDWEIEQLYEFAFYNKIFIVLIESYLGEKQKTNERIFIIDKDCCEIY